MKTKTRKLYFRVFWIFLPNIIKIDLYNFELYRFKVGAFLRHRWYFQYADPEKLLTAKMTFDIVQGQLSGSGTVTDSASYCLNQI